MYYCFNTNCNRWGEAVQFWSLACWPQPGTDAPCPECGEQTYFHDSWNGNRRTHDDGSPVVVEGTLELT